MDIQIFLCYSLSVCIQHLSDEWILFRNFPRALIISRIAKFINDPIIITWVSCLLLRKVEEYLEGGNR